MTHDLAIDAPANGLAPPPGAGRTRRTTPPTVECPRSRCHSRDIAVDAFNRGSCNRCHHWWRPKKAKRVMFWFADWEVSG